ncbi:translation initiation factor IF-2 [Streptomonospora litoralis]|uniref:Translation initiation factor 2 n=1 Tax=Streptomonospora litoralis TaxID=2498135 RepID=A0A4P6Q028_9ACTN|nr:translation initiation factor IF-2 [Streptomonospora litoralis]QBI51847.1 hypothetical protein EKD16_00100 [Streptomonospora litoralis]
MNRMPDAWGTIIPEREVLAVARSVPAAGRLLDVCALLAEDRIGITFTTSPGSASGSGVVELLRDAGVARVLPWAQALDTAAGFDLTLAASAKGQLHRLATPLLLMPHGAGHNRRVGSAPGSLAHASGLDASELLHNGSVVPTRIALSHTEQVHRLAKACPPADGRGVVVGDPGFDRMLAAIGRRERYRTALDTGSRRLIVLSSTWNQGSLLGTQRDLVRALLSELPHDEYRVALIAHPNIWQQRGRAQLELWFADEIEAGLVLIPPNEGWRAAIIASDLVIGDIGSVTYYAAALGRPVLLAAFDATDLDPQSPLHAFGARSAHLNTESPLAPQVAHAIGRAPAPTADLLIEHQGASAQHLRALLYSLLSLPEPATPAHYLPLPDLPEQRDDPTAWRVELDSAPVGTRRSAPVRLRRFPAGAPTHGAGERPLVVDAEDAIMPRWGSADAWSHRREQSETDALVWLRDRLATYPKAALAVATTGSHSMLLLHRCGRAMRVRGDGPALDAAVVAAVASGWAREGRPWDEWRSTIEVALGARLVRLRALPPPAGHEFLAGADF